MMRLDRGGWRMGVLTLGALLQGCGSGDTQGPGWSGGGGGWGSGNGSSSSGGSSGSHAGGSGGSSGSSGSSSGGGSSSSGSSGSGGSSGSSSSSGSSGSGGGSSSGGTMGAGTPPFGGTSHGTGGAGSVSGDTKQAGSVSYRLIVPSGPPSPLPVCIVYSGVEGGDTMTQNLIGLGPMTGNDGVAFAVLDGVTYNGDGTAGATVLDDLRAKYDVDNDRTYLLGESAGTTAAEQLGFHLRQSYFAAYWANDINASDAPAQTAAQLGFAPWGQAGPGGDMPDAQSVVGAMQTAGYRLPSPAPYNGAGSTSHGDPNQFIAALNWFPGKTRQ